MHDFLVCRRVFVLMHTCFDRLKRLAFIPRLKSWAFCSFDRKQDKLEYLPEAKTKSFRKKAFDADQVKALVKNSRDPTIEDKRNHAMVLLTLNTDLRRSEICNLKIEDVHRYYITVQRGKREKNRDVYLHEEIGAVILEYAAMRNYPSSPYLFTTRKGSITTEYMGNIAQDIKGKTGVKEFSWHKCRHTYAKNMIRNGVDLETLRQMLGHEELTTTGIYSVMDTAEALERMAGKPVKFYNEGGGFKSSKPWYSVNGPVGI